MNTCDLQRADEGMIMVDRRSVFVALPLLGAAALPSAAQAPRVGVPASAETVHVTRFGAKGDGVTDDTAALQAALDAALGKTLVFEPRTYRTTETLWVGGHQVRIEGNGALIEFGGHDQPAIDCRRVAGRVYPQEIRIRQLDINLNGPNATALAVRLSHSSIEDVYVTLRREGDASVGFDLVGDEEYGSGPYYNLFKNCSVQGQGQNQVGVRFSHSALHTRAPNANTWIGGRVGQCKIAFDVSGAGSSFFNPTIEGCGTAFSFERATDCSVFGCYLEVCSIGFALGADSLRNGIIGIFATGVPHVISDQGTENWTLSAFAPAPFYRGVRFGATSGDPTVLDAYQEGRWVPSVRGSEEHGEYRVSPINAEYVRIGRQVTVIAEFGVEAVRAGRGTLTIGGLPFPPATDYALVGTLSSAGVVWPASVRATGLRVLNEGDHMEFAAIGARNNDVPFILPVQDLSTRATLSLNATYFTKG